MPVFYTVTLSEARGNKYFSLYRERPRCRKIVDVSFCSPRDELSRTPFVLIDETIPTIAKNISDLISIYIKCSTVNTVIFSCGFHGRRKDVFNLVMSHISILEYRFIPFLLWCDMEENLIRMKADKRSMEGIERDIGQSVKVFNDISYSEIDITNFSVEESAKFIIEQARL